MSSQFPELPDPDLPPPVASPAPAPSPSPWPADAGASQPWAPPVRSGPSPLAGIPKQDYARDIIAAILLIWSLFLRWDFVDTAGGNVAVLLITILSIASLGVTYLARLGVGGLTPVQARTIRLGANVPYAVLAIVYIFIDVFAAEFPSDGLFGYGSSSGHGGVGNALAVGLAAIVLAAQPRKSELRSPEQERTLTHGWRIALAGTAILVALASVVSFIIWVATIGRFVGELGGWAIVVIALVSEVIMVLVACRPAYGAYRFSGGWRIVTIMVGAVMTVGMLFSLAYNMGGGTGGATSSYYSGVQTSHMTAFLIVFIPLLGAVAASPALDASIQPDPSARRWSEASRGSLWTALVYGLGMLLVIVLALVIAAQAGATSGVLILLLVLVVIVTAVAGFAWYTLGARAGQARGTALLAAAVLVIVGLAELIMMVAGLDLNFSMLDLLTSVGVPAVIAYAYFFVPGLKELSGGQFGAAPSLGGPMVAGPAQSMPTAGYQAQPSAPGSVSPQPVPASAGPVPQGAPAPAAPPPPPPAPTPDPVAVEAANPNTALARLAEIAQKYPQHRAAVAANPSAYKGLLDWLAGLGDPEVTAALRRRG